MSDPVDDILQGVKKIAEHMRQLGFDMPDKRCFKWIAAGHIPHTKIGKSVISSKSAIREKFLDQIK